MRHSLILLAAALSSMAAGSACAMTGTSQTQVRCTVTGGERLPASSGGAAALCEEIKRAAGNAASGPVDVTVNVRSAYWLVAGITTADGRALPEQNLARSDRELSRASFTRFAQAIAGAVAESAQP